VSKVPLIARKVIARFWPGPLTVVFGDEADRGGPWPAEAEGGEQGIGIRVPASKVAQDILHAADVPALVTSANRSGEPPAITAQQAIDSLGEQVDVIVDGGEARLKEASTVVRFSRGRWEILREGLISTDMIAKQAQVAVLFVCTGNTCRSPLAEVLLQKHLCRRIGCAEGRACQEQLAALGYTVLSAGTQAVPGEGATQEARQVARLLGCSLAEHSTRPLTGSMVEDADLVFAMAHEHLETIESLGGKGKAFLLGDDEIQDPLGGDLNDFRDCAEEIEEYIVEPDGGRSVVDRIT
jgi:protein-tyrosine-phosphatase